VSTAEILAASLVAVTGALVWVTWRQFRAGRTRVEVRVAQGTYYRSINYEPYRAVRVEIVNHSPHKVQLKTVKLQILRLMPLPGWKDCIQINPVFVGEVGAKNMDEFDFEKDELTKHASDSGWRRGPRLVRVRVEIVTLNPKYSGVAIASLG
jgi:hypothetical protein